MTLSVVQEKGQVTIPAGLRKRWKLKKGAMVAFVNTDKGILISPQEVVAMQALNKIGSILKDNGVRLEELMKSGRKIRGKIIEENYSMKNS